jgi:DNA-binding MarR family transcriptional regulator
LDGVILILVGVLLVVTIGAAIKYYKQLRSVQREYEKAEQVVADIVLSFNRQIRQEADKLERVAYKVEAVSSKSDNALRKAEEVDKKLLPLESRIGVALGDREKLLTRLDEVDKKVRDTFASQEALTAKISAIEEQTRRFSIVPDAKIEAVIPIKREKVLAPLTETELSVLEMLSVEGPKTAPEIKEKIKLSREHTARLMKKLYESGYLERETGKIPFRYSVKKEMEKLLRKAESETT